MNKINSMLTRSFFNKSFNKTLLGRWNRSCDQSTEIKVNWANVDHCGTCSKEDLNKKYIDVQLQPRSQPQNWLKPMTQTSGYHTSTIVEDDLIYHFDEYPEVIEITKPKKMNTTGIDYFLTRKIM
jgi:hypothetical protein